MNRFLYFGFLLVFLLGITGSTDALEISSIPNGLALFGNEKLLRENGGVTVYAVIDFNNNAFSDAILPLADKIHRYIHDLRIDMRPQVRKILQDRINRMLRTPDYNRRIKSLLGQRRTPSTRQRRGLINFVGDLSKTLFGLATQGDIDAVKQGIDQIADQTQLLLTSHNKLVGVVNKVGAEQIKQMEKVNELINRTNVLHTDIKATSLYVEWAARNMTGMMHHLKLRHNVEFLLSDLESRYLDFLQLSDLLRNQRIQCEIGSVTDELLPLPLLMSINERNGNQDALPYEWYYRTLKVETMFRDEEGRFVCKYTVPLLSNENYIAYNLHTYPVFHANNSFAVRLYHDVYVAIGTHTGELFYPEQCKGIGPVVCHAGLRYDKSRELCVRGLITGSAENQKYCPISIFKSIDNSQSVKEVTRNKFVVHTSQERYSYRCPNEKPKIGEFSYGTYIVEIDANCVLDTNYWMIEGLTYHEIYQYFNITTIEIPDVPILSESNWNKLNTLASSINIIDRLEIPNFDEIPTVPLLKDHFEVKKSVIKLWYFWVILIIALFLTIMIIGYVYHTRCISLKLLHESFVAHKSLVNAMSTTTELHELDATSASVIRKESDVPDPNPVSSDHVSPDVHQCSI